MNENHIFTVILILSFILLLGINFIGPKEEYTELKSMTFTVQYVNLVQYSNFDDLSGYVYLLSPNGKRHKISSMDLYQNLKNHIGQKIDLEIEVTYYFDKNGKRIDKKEEFTKPINVLKIYGEEQSYEETINNVEIRRYPTVVPIPIR